MNRKSSSASQKKGVLNAFVSNTGWMMFRNIYSMLISLVIGSISARFLGPSNYGLLNYGSSIISFFTTVSKLGMDSVVVAEMVRTPEKENTYLGTALAMRLVVSIMSFFAIAGFVIVLEPDNKLLQIVTLLQAIAIIFQSIEVLYFWFQAKLEMKYVTIASIFALTATAIWRITLLMNEASVEWFALSASISALVCGVCIGVFFFKKAKVKLAFNWNDGKFILQNSYHFIINGLAVTLYTQLDRIMLGKIVSEEAVGFYAAASTLAVMWEFVPTAVVNSARPLLVKKYDSDRSKFLQQFQLLLLGITFMGVLVGLFFTVFAKLIVFILYGEAYYSAVPVLMILIWSTSFAMIGTARGVWIVAERKNKYSKYFTIWGAVVNAALNAIVIPFWGIVGASITTLFSQIVVAFIAPMFYSDTKEFVKIYVDAYKQLPQFIQILKNIKKG